VEDIAQTVAVFVRPFGSNISDSTGLDVFHWNRQIGNRKVGRRPFAKRSRRRTRRQ
jgi:hypothetical protein